MLDSRPELDFEAVAATMSKETYARMTVLEAKLAEPTQRQKHIVEWNTTWKEAIETYDSLNK